LLAGREGRATMGKGASCPESPGRHSPYPNPFSDSGKARDIASCRTAKGLANGIEGIREEKGSLGSLGPFANSGEQCCMGRRLWLGPLMENQHSMCRWRGASGMGAR
jgi:hypothetical protein